MGYVEDNLIPGETIIWQGRHDILAAFRWTLLFLVVALVANGSAAFVGLALIAAFFELSRYLSDEFGVTNRRVITKRGLIGRRIEEFPLQKIESTLVHQGIVARILGYGDLVLTGTGSTRLVFNLIRRPVELRLDIQHQIDVCLSPA